MKKEDSEDGNGVVPSSNTVKRKDPPTSAKRATPIKQMKVESTSVPASTAADPGAVVAEPAGIVLTDDERTKQSIPAPQKSEVPGLDPASTASTIASALPTSQPTQTPTPTPALVVSALLPLNLINPLAATKLAIPASTGTSGTPLQASGAATKDQASDTVQEAAPALAAGPTPVHVGPRPKKRPHLFKYSTTSAAPWNLFGADWAPKQLVPATKEDVLAAFAALPQESKDAWAQKRAETLAAKKALRSNVAK